MASKHGYSLLILPCLLLFVIVYTLVGGNQMPMVGGFGTAVVQSGSMEPTYSVGDLLFIKEASDYEVGDVVVYQSDNMLVVHRIVEIDGNRITTQGDANNVADEPFSASNIMGRVIGSVPGVGNVIDFLKTPLGFILLVGSAMALMVISFRRELKGE